MSASRTPAGLSTSRPGGSPSASGSAAARKRARSGAVVTRPAAACSAKAKSGMRPPAASCGKAVAAVRCQPKLLAVMPSGWSTSACIVGERPAGELLDQQLQHAVAAAGVQPASTGRLQQLDWEAPARLPRQGDLDHRQRPVGLLAGIAVDRQAGGVAEQPTDGDGVGVEQ